MHTVVNEQFKRRIGTTKDVFQTMLCILQDAYDKDHILGGSPSKVTWHGQGLSVPSSIEKINKVKGSETGLFFALIDLFVNIFWC